MKNNGRNRISRAAARGQRGFTIMEVLIVLAIIALIMGVLVGPRLWGSAKEAKSKTAAMTAGQFAAAYARWSLDHEAACPDSINDLTKYMANKKDVKDPWGREFQMLCGPNAPAEADGFGIMSPGPDGNPNTDDDVTSWKR
jgi:general secretion pathway protein G